MNTATITEDWAPVDGLDRAPDPQATVDRDAICRAIRTVARSTGGIVTAATVRDILAADPLAVNINPHRVGAIVSGLVRSGVLIDTGRTSRSGNAKQRNTRRLMPVYSCPDVERVR